MTDILKTLQSYLQSHGVAELPAAVVTGVVAVALITLLSALIGYLSGSIMLRLIKRMIVRSRNKLDDLLVEFKVLDKFFALVPVVAFHWLSRHILGADSMLGGVLTHLSAVVIIIIVMVSLDATLESLLHLYHRCGLNVAFPVKSFVQVLKVLVYLVGGVLIVATLIGKTPVFILSGMGALTAVLLLIFKDPILGLTAGIQLTKNDMVRLGDWIEMPKYGADGSVIDLALTTVKVQNWDNTVTTVPTYALISESFKNWRFMSESGGRRIKRSLYIDMNSVRFCSEEMLLRFSRIQYIADYIRKKQDEIKSYNETHRVDLESLANGRRMTNLGVLRAYMEAYLQNHPMINKELILMVRQLAPTPEGLPLEVYCFCADRAWVNYEKIQSDIYDHFIAVVAAFDLRLFQNPSGADFAAISRAASL